MKLSTRILLPVAFAVTATGAFAIGAFNLHDAVLMTVADLSALVVETDVDEAYATQISAGFRHNCGVRPDGSAECWGDNAQGQATAPAGTFAQVSGGSSHSCAVTGVGDLMCWGRGDEGQLLVPSGSFVRVVTGAAFSCALGNPTRSSVKVMPAPRSMNHRSVRAKSVSIIAAA